MSITVKPGVALAFVVLAFVVSCGRGRPRNAVGGQPIPGRYRVSDEGLALMRQDEAFVGNVYDDGVGNATIGYGHMLEPGESFPGGISESAARDLLAKDVGAVVNPALDRVAVPLTQHQVDALGDFIYNVGPGNFTRFVLPALNAGDYARAETEMRQFTRGKNQRTGELVTMRGLQRRRQQELALFEET
jgi:lysozyme